MNAGLKKVSWRMLGVALLGLSLVAVASFSFGVATRSSATAHANTVRRGTITQGKTLNLTAMGKVDWSKLPTISAHSASVAKQPIVTNRDLVSPAQRAAYYQALKTGKIKAPFAIGQPAPAKAQLVNGANLGSNIDACGYSDLPCELDGHNGISSANSSCGCTPPDQAIASNTGAVMEGVNNAYVLYRYTGAVIYGPTAATSFFGSIMHAGDFLSDPQMFWDSTRQRWIIVEIEIHQSGGTTTDYYDIGISTGTTGDVHTPADWYLYQFSANVNLNGTPNWCDYPTLGSDYWGIWLDCVAFGQTSGFLGNVVFALDKTNLYSGHNTTVFSYDNIPTGISNGSGGFQPAYRLSSVLEDGTPDAEFLIATDEGYTGGPYSDLTTVAFTDTVALNSGSAPHGTYIINTMPVTYVSPINASQPGLPQSVYPGVGTKQVVYQSGDLFFAFTTAINSGTQDGVYWAEVEPQLSGLNPASPQSQTVASTLVRQAAIWSYANGADSYMPSFVGSTEDDAALVFNYSSSAIDPSIVETGRRATDPLNTMGDGNNSVYVIEGTNTNTTGRYGDYSACSVAPNVTTRGTMFCGGEYGGTQSGSGGWDTYIYGLRVE